MAVGLVVVVVVLLVMVGEVSGAIASEADVGREVPQPRERGAISIVVELSVMLFLWLAFVEGWGAGSDVDGEGWALVDLLVE